MVRILVRAAGCNAPQSACPLSPEHLRVQPLRRASRRAPSRAALLPSTAVSVGDALLSVGPVAAIATCCTDSVFRAANHQKTVRLLDDALLSVGIPSLLSVGIPSLGLVAGTAVMGKPGESKGDDEQDAAQKAAVHAETPSIEHLDVLGRTFLTVQDNHYTDVEVLGGDGTSTITDKDIETRVVLDIEGHEREVIDAHDRVIMRNDWDMAGRQMRTVGMDAG